MGRSFADYDESDVRVRPGKGSRPRSKKRPTHDDAEFGLVVAKDRGRWGVVLDATGTRLQCTRARELKRTSIEVGDRVGVVGDTSGAKDTLARIVKREDRSSVLRRTADDTDPYERIIVANAQLLLIVVAAADPPPRTGFVERALIAAFVGGVTPVVCVTKTDLADPSDFERELEAMGVEVLRTGVEDGVEQLRELIRDQVSALIGHSGVGKSTLVNRIVPDADRETGEVSGVARAGTPPPSPWRSRCPAAAGSSTPPASAPSAWRTSPPKKSWTCSRTWKRRRSAAPAAARTWVPRRIRSAPGTSWTRPPPSAAGPRQCVAYWLPCTPTTSGS